MLHDSMYKLQSKRLVTMSVSLHTQTGLHILTIQVQSVESIIMDTQCNFLTSVALHIIIQSIGWS